MMKAIRSEFGSMYVLSATFAIAALLLLSALVLVMRMIVLSYDISRSFEQNGADLITDVRIHYFTSVTETDLPGINTDINLPSSAAFRRQMCTSFTLRLAASLGCVSTDGIPTDGIPSAFIKQNSDGTTVYEVNRIAVAFDDNVGIVTAELHIPIRFNGKHVADYTKSLEYRFALTMKEVSE